MPRTQSTSALKYSLIPKGRLLYFDEEAHKYTDDIKTKYTSCTTVIGNYYEKFDKKARDIAAACERIGRNPNHPKHLKYRGKNAKQLLYEWDQTTIVACAKGTKKHDYLEKTVKNANGYTRNANGFINGRIYTIDDIISGHNFGRLSLKSFVKSHIDDMYPSIYNIIKDFVSKGFRIYSEIGVYDTRFGISGLIDILLVRGTEFVILDWKTNKAPIKFESGYFEKDNDGKLMLDTFISKDEYFLSPLAHLPDSVGNHYTLQLSIYDYLVESFGFKCIGNILCHIRTIEKSVMDFSEDEEKEEVTFIPIKYLKSDVELLLRDHVAHTQPQTTLF